MKSILIIEDEIDVSEMLGFYLRQHGRFDILVADDGFTGYHKAVHHHPAVVVLDLMLPQMSGFEVCRLLRANPRTTSIPILILTARVAETDRIRGFELGTDDYVTKPFSPREVCLRIQALAQRSSAPPREWQVGNVSVNGTRHEVSVGGRAVQLTAIEFKLLTHLIETRGRTQSRDHLLNEVWEYSGSMTTRTVDTAIQRLRKKLSQSSDMIETVRTYGYRIASSPTQNPSALAGE